MSKAANTYWDNERTGRKPRSNSRAAAARKQTGFFPKWYVFFIPAVLSALVVLTINVRGWTYVENEHQINEQLGAEIEQLTIQNELLQDEINRLQYDPKTIEREARKLGMGRANEKVFVPTQ